MGLLSDPAWLQVIIGIIALVASLIGFIVGNFIKKNKKGIVFEIISNTPILSIHDEVKGNLQVLYDNKPVDDIRLLVLKLWNYRRGAIEPKDYILPIIFNFGANAEVLATTVLDETPSDIKKELEGNGLIILKNEIEIKPILLHSKDFIRFKVLVTKFEKVEVSARINGVSRIISSEELPTEKNRRTVEQWFREATIIFLIAMGVFLIEVLTIQTATSLSLLKFDLFKTPADAYLFNYPPSLYSIIFLVLQLTTFFIVISFIAMILLIVLVLISRFIKRFNA
jgi:hypothetical protein